jgi:hypothetical protein
MRLYFWSVRNFMKDVIDMLEIVHWRLLASAGILIFYCLIFSIRSGDSYRVSLLNRLSNLILLRLGLLLAFKLELF